MRAISKEVWGKLPTGEEIDLYTLRNAHGLEATITNFGGRLVTLKVPDRGGKFEDIVLGFDSLDLYVAKNPFFGALAGRYANRIANGEFKLDGHTYKLLKNNGSNTLHGGAIGFDKVAWHGALATAHNGPALQIKYLSKDGEEGFPGNLHSMVTYSLTDDNALHIDYEATTDKDTVLNLTNHSYFNLAGHGRGKILEHQLVLNAGKFTPVNANLIPTGELQAVEGTPFDFRHATAIGLHIDSKEQQIQYGEGYDHNFVVNRSSKEAVLAARVSDPGSGRVMEVLTTQPGVQFYTANHLVGEIKGKNGATYRTRGAYCFETQHFPDSPNHPQFPTSELKPGQLFKESTIFRFSAS
ncbi:MAG TPA: aldose epimerase family protein [Bryobacteraceae bacterium]|nr:aldose epimerase family protein [Bryobacteraceae bacterium]